MVVSGFVKPSCEHGEIEVERFRIGDRVEIVGQTAKQLRSKVGVITSVEEASIGKNFTVTLADGAESAFSASQLKIPEASFADLIFDTRVSPAPSGLRGSVSGRHLRFVCREFDIDLKLTGSSGQQRNLLGQLTTDGAAVEPSLVTLLLEGKPFARTVTDSLGEFKLERVRSGSAVLEFLIPARRILATFNVSPSGNRR